MVGAGTTTQAFAHQLTSYGELAVVTNSLLVAEALGSAPRIEVVLTGGTLLGAIHALDIDHLVTDDAAPTDVLDDLATHSIRLHVAGTP